MKTKCSYFIISIFIAVLLFAFIFLVNNNDPKPGIGIYFKLEIIKFTAICTGFISVLIAVGSRILKKDSYNKNFFYILIAVMNFILGLYGIFYFLTETDGIKVLHGFLPNLLLGVLTISDVFLLNKRI